MFRGPSTPILRENTTDEINITNYNIGFKLTNILVLVLVKSKFFRYTFFLKSLLTPFTMSSKYSITFPLHLIPYIKVPMHLKRGQSVLPHPL